MKRINRNTFVAVVLSSLILLSSSFAVAQVPQLLNYQGRVTSGGTNFTGTGLFKFALVNGTGSTSYWSNDGSSSAGGQPAAAVGLVTSNGLFNVLLGNTTIPNMTTAIPAATFTNINVQLRVWFSDGVAAFQQLAPDQRIAAVGYAMIAGTVPDGAITASKLAPGAVGATQLGAGVVGAAQLSAGAVTAAAIAVGAVDNSKLANSSVTVTAGPGLGGGGAVALGGAVTLNNTGVLAVTGAGNISSSGGQNPQISFNGVLPIGNGGTGIGSGPTTAGQFLRSSGAGTWAINTIQPADLPSADPTKDIVGARLKIGLNNILSGVWSTIAGGSNNTANADYATVGGGLQNTASDSRATVGGGYGNTASGPDATVGGGFGNKASGQVSTVGGGDENTASGYRATVGGGSQNTANNLSATVGGGYSNTASGSDATVGGGSENVASGDYATVPGGFDNVAAGTFSFAIGRSAHAPTNNTFVWSDGSVPFNTNINNGFFALASGGYYFYTGGGVGVQVAGGGNSWSVISDRNVKEHFEPVDTRAVLAKVAALPITTWNLKTQSTEIRHIGPMAQDFKAAFAVGEDERHISTSDADGVTFAAIKGLYEVVQEKEARIDELEKRLAAMETRMQKLSDRGGR